MSRISTTLDAPPPATRARPPGWRDPRLWVGVVIVAASVVLGARVIGTADDTVTVWSVAADLAPGSPLEQEDLTAARVHFDDPALAARYLPTEESLPAEARLTRPLHAGELLPRAALGTAEEAGVLRVSVSVPASHVPPALGPGGRVDVWVVEDGRAGAARARPVLEDVVVVAAPAGEAALGVSGGRQLVLGVAEEDAEAVAPILAASGEERVRIVGRG